MTLLADLVYGAKWRADMLNSDRVSDPEWGALANEAVLNAWTLAAGARPDFQVASADVTVASGMVATIDTTTFTTPFFGLIDVVANPDTSSEFSLGPFAWANRRAPGSWGPPPTIYQATGARRARLMGTTIYLEPSTSAGGTYRVWYCPRPTLFVVPDFIVRVTDSADLPGGYVASGSGVGKTLTSVGAGPLVYGGVALGLNDRLLVRNTAAAGDQGIYTVTTAGGVGVAWQLTRATDFDENNEIKLGALIFAQQGTLSNTYWTVSAFTGVDFGAITTGVAIPVPNNTLPTILDPFIEYLKVYMAIPAVVRDERSPADLIAERTALEGQLIEYFSKERVAGGPEKIIDTDARGPSNWWGGGFRGSW